MKTDQHVPYPTRHLRQRMQQRGRTYADCKLIYSYGTEVRPDFYVLRNQDADELIRQNKHLAHAADRLHGWAIVVSEGSAITCYFPDGSAGRKALRGRDYRRRRHIR